MLAKKTAMSPVGDAGQICSTRDALFRPKVRSLRGRQHLKLSEVLLIHHGRRSGLELPPSDDNFLEANVLHTNIHGRGGLVQAVEGLADGLRYTTKD